MYTITKNYLNGNKRETFDLFDNLDDLDKLVYIRNMLQGNYCEDIIDMLSDFIKRYEDKQ